MAHHDSVPGSPGAADDIAGVASSLEIVRAIAARGGPQRDVVLVMTDGEEAGLLGAKAFFEADPLARHLGFLMNLEARGGGGRAIMFETSAQNGAAIDLFAGAARRPLGNSLTALVYKLLPNDTDFTVAKDHGVAGLNFAFIGRQFDYHSPSSTVAVLDQGALQHMGDGALGVAAAVANGPTLPPRTADAVYGNLVGDLLIAYPAWEGWLLLAATAGLLGVAGAQARRRGDLAWRDVAQGVGASLLLLAAGALTLHLVRRLTGSGFGWIGGRALLARFPAYEAALALAALAVVMLVAVGLARGRSRTTPAVVALIVGAGLAIAGGDWLALVEGVAAAVLALVVLGRPAAAAGAWLGLLAPPVVAAVALQVLAPTAAFIVQWPVAAAAVLAAALGLRPADSPARAVIALVTAVLALAWLGAFFHALLQGMDVPELPVLTAWLGAAILWPLAWPGEARAHLATGAALLVAGLAIALGLGLTSPWSARHPRASEPVFLVDQTAGQAWRASLLRPDAWTRNALSAGGAPLAQRSVPGLPATVWAASVRPTPPRPSPLAVTRRPDGTIEVRVAGTPEDLARLELRVSVPVTGAAINGEPVSILQKPGVWARLHWQGSQGLRVTFRPTGAGVVEARYALFHPGWPADAPPLPPMPPDEMAWDWAGSTVLAGSSATRW